MDKFDAWNAEMMQAGPMDHSLVASTLRQLYDALLREGFTPPEALELAKTFILASAQKS